MIVSILCIYVAYRRGFLSFFFLGMFDRDGISSFEMVCWFVYFINIF